MLTVEIAAFLSRTWTVLKLFIYLNYFTSFPLSPSQRLETLRTLWIQLNLSWTFLISFWIIELFCHVETTLWTLSQTVLVVEIFQQGQRNSKCKCCHCSSSDNCECHCDWCQCDCYASVQISKAYYCCGWKCEYDPALLYFYAWIYCRAPSSGGLSYTRCKSLRQFPVIQ